MRTLSALLVCAAFLTVLVPAANAGPNCFQVYPWSELCQGDVDGFLHAVLPCDPATECITITAGPIAPPTPRVPADCIQAIPWSYLCSGNVEAFVEYYTGPIGPILS